MSKSYIVWNTDRTEGFVTTDKHLAYEVRKGARSNCFREDGIFSKTAAAFCDEFSSDQDCTIEELGND